MSLVLRMEIDPGPQGAHIWGKDTYMSKYNVAYAEGTPTGGKEQRDRFYGSCPQERETWLTGIFCEEQIKVVVLRVWLANYLHQNHLEHILKCRFPALPQVGLWDLGVCILKCSR